DGGKTLLEGAIAAQQQTVVAPRYPQHATMEVGRGGNQGATQNATLAVTVVEHLGRIIDQLALMAELVSGGEAIRVLHEFGQKHEVQQALLAAIQLPWQAGQVSHDLMDIAGQNVLLGHAYPVGSAEHDVMFALHGPHVAAAEFAPTDIV